MCHICREVTYPSITERILGCSGPYAPRPADVAGSVAMEVPRLTLAPPPPPLPEAGVARGRRETIFGRGNHALTTHRRALLAQGRAAARRPLLGVGRWLRQAAGWGPQGFRLPDTPTWVGAEEQYFVTLPRRCLSLSSLSLSLSIR